VKERKGRRFDSNRSKKRERNGRSLRIGKRSHGIQIYNGKEKKNILKSEIFV
jgi:hypothetical protein